jgi:hypothetical protein
MNAKTPMPVLLMFVAAVMSAPAAAQYVYPAKGQSPQKQKSDESACHTWAIQQTGYDPAKPPPPAAGPATTATGSTPGAGVRGAARGAVAAEIVGGDADKGAAVGAVANRSRSRRQNAAASQQQAGAGQAEYAKARAACLEGRGYTVK